MPNDTGVTDNAAANRYELAVEGRTAFIDYAREGNRVALLHTEVPGSLEGKGYGTRLVRGALALARERGDRVLPRCAFVQAYLRRHPAERDVVAEG